MAAVGAAERLVTRQALALRHCTLPPWLRLWQELGLQDGFDPNLSDTQSCWKAGQPAHTHNIAME